MRLLPIVYHWVLWLFFTLLIFGQALGAVWTRAAYTDNLVFGQNSALGPFQVLGSNDVPFTDRSYVCSRRSRVYRPVQLAKALDASPLVVVDTAGGAVNGYRVVKRAGFEIDATVMKGYTSTCHAIAATLDAILDRCTELGYNVTRDGLRVVYDDKAHASDSPTSNSDGSGDGRTATRSVLKIVRDALPVLVLPFSDNSRYSRYAIPGWDGSACMVRLNDGYETDGLAAMTMRGLNRSVRELRTAELLGRPGGVWRNGWYEDRAGGRWFSDVMSTEPTLMGIAMREFDMIAVVTVIRKRTNLAIMNDTLFGVFAVSGEARAEISSVYDLEVVLANVSLGVLLVRWAVAMAALASSRLARTERGCEREFPSAGIGLLACARGFHWLPIVLLPRLKTHLAVFASIGCVFEGSQAALTQAWYLMYPGIAELVLLVFSLLNLLAKLLRRRMSDALFGPTLLFYCAAHHFRMELGRSGWFEYDGRIISAVPSAQFESMSALDILTSGALLRLNGNVKSLFFLKVGMLALNVLPLLLSRPARGAVATAATTATAANSGPTTLPSQPSPPLATKTTDGQPQSVGPSTRTRGWGDTERTLALHAASSAQERAAPASPGLSAYDMVRLGYVVVDSAWLMAISDWLLFAPLAACGLLHFASLHVMVFAVRQDAVRSCCVVDEKPVVCQMSDPRFTRCRPWAISSQPFG
ncbi:hypothetical protein PybrP1_007422 [[Pythium] brassicae (nom. inval.)]|nr:hypothetical protein PybrP1_007422 [[Pythium] brassicae (nom. inval.)]